MDKFKREKVETGFSYFGNRNPRHFRVDLAEMKSHHCTFVDHTFAENDQAFYKDTMAELVAMTKEAGLSTWVDPGGVGKVFGGEAYSQFALERLRHRVHVMGSLWQSQEGVGYSLGEAYGKIHGR